MNKVMFSKEKGVFFSKGKVFFSKEKGNFFLKKKCFSKEKGTQVWNIMNGMK